MDPVSAFSVACGVLQCAGIGFKVIATAREVYKQGETEEYAQLQEQTSSLKHITGELRKQLKPSSGVQQATMDQQLREVNETCFKTAHELVLKLAKLRLSSVERDKLKSVLKGMKAVWNESEIERIQQRLRDCQQIVQTSILASIQYVYLHRRQFRPHYSAPCPNRVGGSN